MQHAKHTAVEPLPFNWGSFGTLFGMMNVNSRGHKTLELSRHSQVKIARENNERIIAEWRSYLVPEESSK